MTMAMPVRAAAERVFPSITAALPAWGGPRLGARPGRRPALRRLAGQWQKWAARFSSGPSAQSTIHNPQSTIHTTHNPQPNLLNPESLAAVRRTRPDDPPGEAACLPVCLSAASGSRRVAGRRPCECDLDITQMAAHSTKNTRDATPPGAPAAILGHLPLPRHARCPFGEGSSLLSPWSQAGTWLSRLTTEAPGGHHVQTAHHCACSLHGRTRVRSECRQHPPTRSCRQCVFGQLPTGRLRAQHLAASSPPGRRGACSAHYRGPSHLRLLDSTAAIAGRTAVARGGRV